MWRGAAEEGLGVGELGWRKIQLEEPWEGVAEWDRSGWGQGVWGGVSEARWDGILGRWRAGTLWVGDGGDGGQDGRPSASSASILEAGPRGYLARPQTPPISFCLSPGYLMLPWHRLILPAPALSPCLCCRF